MFTMDTKQQNIHKELVKLDKKSAEAYKGSLEVLRDRENPDRFSRSAHSLREITALISRKISIPQESKENRKSLENKLEKQFIEKTDLLPSPAEKKTKVLLEKWGGEITLIITEDPNIRKSREHWRE